MSNQEQREQQSDLLGTIAESGFVPNIKRIEYENLKRAIYIDEVIDEALFKKLSKQILEFRLESSDPITVYLDSTGGSVYYSKQIWNLLKAPRRDKSICDIYTVVHSSCGSAASDLLFHGDYVLTYPKTVIHYHGLIQSLNTAINTEDAAEISNELRQMNSEYAFDLTSHIWLRIIDIIFTLGATSDPAHMYLEYLAENISPKNTMLVNDLQIGFEELVKLTEVVYTLKVKQETRMERDLRIFNALVKYKTKEATQLFKKGYTFPSEDIINDLMKQFRIILDIEEGKYMQLLEDQKIQMIELFKALPEDLSIRKNFEDGQDLESRVNEFLFEVLFLTLTFSRLILRGENYLSAEV